MKSNSYTVDFTIPQRPTGPTGPSGLKAYGGRYNNASTTLNLQANTTVKVPLLNMMPPRKESYTNETNIILENSGTYELTYKITATSNKNTQLTLVIQENGIDIPASINEENVY